MRFLLGIFVGGALTLLVATAVDAPTNPIVERAQASWEQLIELTSRALFPRPSVAAEPAAARQPAPPASTDTHTPAPAPLAAGSTATAASDRSLPAPQQDKQVEPPFQAEADDTAAALADQDPAAAAGIDVDSLVAAADRELQGLGRRAVTERPVANASADPISDTARDVGGRMPFIEDASAAGTDDLPLYSPADGDDLAGVWSPFHSERSARGFARRLSDQFQHPFSVERIGPGAYQVVFSYTDTAERDALLAEIQEGTGL